MTKLFNELKLSRAFPPNRTKKLVPLLCAGLSACTMVGPDYQPPQTDVSEDWVAADTVQTTLDPITLDWWTLFNDPLLEHYINLAIENNNTLHAALANVQRARSLREEQVGALRPQIDVNSNVTRSKSSGTLNNNSNNGGTRTLFDAGFDASWEIDIFGANRRAIEAAEARVGSAIADYRATLLSTLSEVARNYYEARGLQKRIAVTEQNTELLRQTYIVIRARLQAGEASQFDLTRARGEYQLTQARIPNLNAEMYAALFRISVLLGNPPETLFTEMLDVRALPTPLDIVPVGLRSDILRRRPDIQKAERDLAASVADIGVETAELFPKFFVTGSAGSQARVFGDLFKTSSGVWSLAGMVDWSLFEGGAIRARINASEAVSEAAVAQYQQTVLDALADTETTLSNYGRELATLRALEQGVQSRRQSVALAQELFDAGEEDYLAVLDAERELTSSEDDLVVSETQTTLKLIALYTALGGGWEIFDSR